MAAEVEAIVLGDGWLEIMDESSGQPYFYNENTQETTWERPQIVYVTGYYLSQASSEIFLPSPPLSHPALPFPSYPPSNYTP